MANTKSAIKRLRSMERRYLRNRSFEGRARTAVKKARLLIGGGKIDDARTAVKVAVKALDKAAEKGIIHKNNAARRKSRLMRQFNEAENAG